jgi:hypothetical protein
VKIKGKCLELAVWVINESGKKDEGFGVLNRIVPFPFRYCPER